MEYHHHSSQDMNVGNAFKTGITINILFVLLEVTFGFLSNSMALVADAGHNLSDVLALVFSWIAIRLSMAKPTLKFTYGFRRSTILIAILNTIMLLAAMSVLLWETVRRLGRTEAVDSISVIIIASVGIFINSFTAWLFFKGKSQDLNIRSAFLHFIADALVSFGVVIGGLIMLFTGLFWIDSVVSLIVIAVILYSTYKLLIDSVSLALDAVPENIDIDSVRTYLKNLPEVSNIHDLHIWALSTNVAALTVHLETHKNTDNTFINRVQQQLNDKFNIEHSTIQIEYGEQTDHCNDCN